MVSHHHTPKLACLAAMAILILAGCGKNSSDQTTPDLEKTASPHNAHSSPDQITAPDRRLSPDERRKRQEDQALQDYLDLLESQDYQSQAGDVLARLNVSTQEELRQALNQPPGETCSAMVNRRTNFHLRQPDIGARHQVMPLADIPHLVRKRNPLLKTGDRVTLPTVKGRMVTGKIMARNRNVVRVGTVYIAREDLPFELRAKIWPEENQELIRRTIREQTSRTRQAVRKFVEPKLAQELPELFFQAGYLPDPTRKDASLTNPDPECWIPRTTILQAMRRRKTTK